MANLWAHSANVANQRQLLVDHLRGTAALAGAFGLEFGAEEFCRVAGLVHDLGKMIEPWQDYLILSEKGFASKSVNHKTAGAHLFKCIAGEPGRLIIEGHHSGIPNWNEPLADNVLDIDRDRLVADLAPALLPELEGLLAAGNVVPETWRVWGRDDHTALELGIRLAHSALVDADFLDTSAHFSASPVPLRLPADFTDLSSRFEGALESMLAGRSGSPIDDLRASLLDECLAAAALPRGVFRLPAPTGSGKTISAAAFALAHAAHHGLRRVIVAVPFLSITEQNAAVYRSLLGDENVIEHHSGVNPQTRSDMALWRARYGTENWDAPFVVTTTVQLFESMFSNRPAKTRKLHRLANAVVILDEVQAIPPRVLPVVLDGLRILQEHFGTTVVLSSATQPTWDLLGPWRGSSAVQVRDIVSDPLRLYAGLRRSTIEWASEPSLESIADRMAAEPQVMTVVNTTGNARDLARVLRERVSEGTLHLSTRMYAGHRRDVLGEVRQRLVDGLPVHLVSTQLVEAGVDLDFPVVMRALAPAENLAQARGRCNREGRLPSGRFVVLQCVDLVELSDYRTGIAKTLAHFRDPQVDIDDPAAMRRYYADLYAALAVDDQRQAGEIQRRRAALRYRQVSTDFRMIAEEAHPVVVATAPGAEALLVDLAVRITRREAPAPERFRRLQEFSVNLPARSMGSLSAYVAEELPGVSVWRGPYDPLTGVTIDSATPHDSVW